LNGALEKGVFWVNYGYFEAYIQFDYKIEWALSEGYSKFTEILIEQPQNARPSLCAN
jgi:hypothetical protein